MSHPSILVVEDSHTMRVLLRTTLEAEGYQVVLAPDGRAARDLARMEAPDLVILDLLLPDSDGLDLARDLRATEGFEHVPLVAFSAYPTLREKAEARGVRFADFLVKPVDPHELLEVVRRNLGVLAN